MSVKRCRREVDSPEFVNWIAYNNIEPFGERRMDLRFAHACCLFASAHRKTGAPKPQLADFLIDKILGSDDQTVEEMLQVAMGIEGMTVVDNEQETR